MTFHSVLGMSRIKYNNTDMANSFLQEMLPAVTWGHVFFEEEDLRMSRA